MTPSIRTEFLPMLKIAVPVVLAELGWMTMGVVDTVMVGGLGPEAISAAGVGNAMHIAFAIFGMAVMLGLDTLVSQAYGARDLRDCHRWFFDGLTLAGLMTVPIMALLALVWFAIPYLGFHAAVRPLLESYFGVLMLSTPFLLAYAVCRRYLQGMHAVTPVMFALITANLINAAANWLLIYGHSGFPALGVAGSAWATVISRAYMLGALLLAVWWIDKKRTAEALRTSRRDRRGRPRPTAMAKAGLWHVDRAWDGARLRQVAGAGLARGLAGGRRGRRVRAGDRAVRHARSDLQRVAPDRAQPRRRRVHGAARPRVRRRGAGRSRGRRARSAARLGGRMDRDHAGGRFHDRRGADVRDPAAAVDRPVLERRRRAVGRHVAAAAGGRSSSCSTASRA